MKVTVGFTSSHQAELEEIELLRAQVPVPMATQAHKEEDPESDDENLIALD